MNFLKRILPVLVSMALTGVMCTKKNSTEPEPEPVQGKITAVAAGIAGQNGNVYSVMVYESDWAPGSTATVVAGILAPITGDDFSLTQKLHPVDPQSPGGYSSEDKVFEPKTYSVVFFVSPQGSAPQHFAEVRVAVNGDVTATAPIWADWVHF
jgi:hypothetical protein